MTPEKQICFEKSLHLMKKGYNLKRLSWRGKKTNVFLHLPSKEEVCNVPFLCVSTSIGTTGPWTPTQCDMNAKDWVIAIMEKKS